MTGVGPVTVAKARQLVVVSAGAFGSPGILERSGIGSSSILEKRGIPVVVDLPGVGENYLGMSIRYTDFNQTDVISQITSTAVLCAMRQMGRTPWMMSGRTQKQSKVRHSLCPGHICRMITWDVNGARSIPE